MFNSKRGFMLIETLLVSLTITGILMYLYVQFVNINNSYTNVYRYNTTNELYITDKIKEYIILNAKDSLYTYLDNTTGNGYIEIYTGSGSVSTTYFDNTELINAIIKETNITKIMVTSGDVTKVKNYVKGSSSYDKVFKDFVRVMSNQAPVDGKNKYRVIVEFKDDKASTLLFFEPEAETEV